MRPAKVKSTGLFAPQKIQTSFSGDSNGFQQIFWFKFFPGMISISEIKILFCAHLNRQKLGSEEYI